MGVLWYLPTTFSALNRTPPRDGLAAPSAPHVVGHLEAHGELPFVSLFARLPRLPILVELAGEARAAALGGPVGWVVEAVRFGGGEGRHRGADPSNPTMRAEPWPNPYGAPREKVRAGDELELTKISDGSLRDLSALSISRWRSTIARIRDGDRSRSSRFTRPASLGSSEGPAAVVG